MPNLDDIVSLAKRRGFFWPSCEIYSSVSGFFDYGNTGFALKKKWCDEWRKHIVGLDPNFHEIEACDIMPEEVFVGSGHLKNFTDPIAECSKCHAKMRADHLVRDNTELKDEDVESMSPEQMMKVIEKEDIRCQSCKSRIKSVELFNMMWSFDIGPTFERKVCLRPETAQGPYLNFKQMFEVARRKLPLGLGVIGKAYRNEVSPRNLLFRQREFTQAEMQVFFDPDTIKEHPKFSKVKNYKVRLYLVKNRAKNKTVELTCEEVVAKKILPKFYVYHMAMMQKFFLNVMKIPKDKFRWRELSDEEKAFYNKYHFDAEAMLESMGGFKEIAGLHYRTDHDLGGHQKNSNEDLSVNVEGKKILCHVTELSFGVDRNIFALIDMNYGLRQNKIVLKVPKNMAPISAGIFPIVKNDAKVRGLAEKVYDELRMGLDCFYDASGSVGKRYARADEIGVPYCITVDFDSLKDNSVTVRDRDSTKQVRVKIDKLEAVLKDLLRDRVKFAEAGKQVK